MLFAKAGVIMTYPPSTNIIKFLSRVRLNLLLIEHIYVLMLETSGAFDSENVCFKIDFGVLEVGYAQIKKRRIRHSVFVSEIGSEKYVTNPLFTEAFIPASMYSPGADLLSILHMSHIDLYDCDTVEVRRIYKS